MEDQPINSVPYKSEAKTLLWVMWILLIIVELFAMPAATFLGGMSTDSGSAAGYAQAHLISLIPLSFLILPIISSIFYVFRKYLISIAVAFFAFLEPFAALALFLKTLH